MIEAYKKFILNYSNFRGRSTQGDYWWVMLANFLIGLIFGLFGKYGLIVANVYSIVTLIPGIALTIRRLHDTNRSGWNYLWILLPIAGPIILIVFLCLGSVNENNKYGDIV